MLWLATYSKLKWISVRVCWLAFFGGLLSQTTAIRALVWDNLVPWECGLGVRDLWGPNTFYFQRGQLNKKKIVPGVHFYYHNRTSTSRHSLSHRYPRATDILLKTEPSASDTDPSQILQDPHDPSRAVLSPGFCCTRFAGTKLFRTSST